MTEIQIYIRDNWDSLPKSKFNTDEVVIFHCVKDEQYGYGHHIYEGYGVNQTGQLLWCYSSGCSCGGSVSVEDRKVDFKVFMVDGIDLNIDPKSVNFSALEVSYEDY